MLCVVVTCEAPHRTKQDDTVHKSHHMMSLFRLLVLSAALNTVEHAVHSFQPKHVRVLRCCTLQLAACTRQHNSNGDRVSAPHPTQAKHDPPLCAHLMYLSTYSLGLPRCCAHAIKLISVSGSFAPCHENAACETP